MLTYTLTIANAGPDTAENIILYDEVPPELAGVQFSVDGGATWSVWANPYLLGMILSGQSRTILIRGTVAASACGIISNTAVVKGDTPDPNPSNNTSSANTPVEIGAGADLSVRKTVFPDPAIRGCQLNYTLIVTNNGPETAEQVVAYDDLPNELLKPVYSLGNSQTVNPWTGRLIIGNLAPGETVTVVISALVSDCAKGYIKNSAEVSSSTSDPNLSNNRDSVMVKLCSCCKNSNR